MKKRHTLYEPIREFVLQTGKCSIGLLQERFSIGVNAASMIIDDLEEAGVIGPFLGNPFRKVLVKK